MNKSLIPFARLMGDLKLSVNGETVIGFNTEGNWVNNFTYTVTGDQGCLFGDPSVENPSSAIVAVKNILENITLVPYQNDVTFQEYVTPEAQEWFSKTAIELIKKGFSDPSVYKVELAYKPEGASAPHIVIHVELASNPYVNYPFENAKDITLLGKVKSTEVTDDGNVTYIYEKDGVENTLKREFDDNLFLVGITGFESAEYIYECAEEKYILTTGNFVPEISESKVVKL